MRGGGMRIRFISCYLSVSNSVCTNRNIWYTANTLESLLFRQQRRDARMIFSIINKQTFAKVFLQITQTFQQSCPVNIPKWTKPKKRIKTLMPDVSSHWALRREIVAWHHDDKWSVRNRTSDTLCLYVYQMLFGCRMVVWVDGVNIHI